MIFSLGYDLTKVFRSIPSSWGKSFCFSGGAEERDFFSGHDKEKARSRRSVPPATAV